MSRRNNRRSARVELTAYEVDTLQMVFSNIQGGHGVHSNDLDAPRKAAMNRIRNKLWDLYPKLFPEDGPYQ